MDFLAWEFNQAKIYLDENGYSYTFKEAKNVGKNAQNEFSVDKFIIKQTKNEQNQYEFLLCSKIRREV